MTHLHLNLLLSLFHGDRYGPLPHTGAVDRLPQGVNSIAIRLLGDAILTIHFSDGLRRVVNLLELIEQKRQGRGSQVARGRSSCWCSKLSRAVGQCLLCSRWLMLAQSQISHLSDRPIGIWNCDRSQFVQITEKVRIKCVPLDGCDQQEMFSPTIILLSAAHLTPKALASALSRSIALSTR